MAPDAPSPEQQALYDSRKKIRDQFLQFDKANIIGIAVDDWTPFYKTNNFFQRTLAHTLAFDDINQAFRLLQVDSNGFLKVSQTVSVSFGADLNGTTVTLKANALNALRVDPFGRELTVDTVMDALSIPGSASATHVGVNLAHAAQITCLVNASDSITVRPQISDDNNNWYDLVDETDTIRTFAVNNQKRAFRIQSAAKYLRLFVTNNATTATIVTAKILGQA